VRRGRFRQRLGALRHRVLPGRQEMASGLNATGMNLGNSLSSPELVLPILIRSLGGSNVLIGVLPAMRWSLMWLPQFLVSGRIQERKSRIPVYLVMEAGRAICYALIGLSVVLFLPERAGLFLWLLFLLYATSRVVAGTGFLALTDAFGRIVHHEGRAHFFAVRSFAGGFGGLLAGGLVGLAFRLMPDSMAAYGLLFGASALAFFGAMAAARGLREPEAPASAHHVSLAEQFQRVPTLLRTPNFGRFLAVRVLVAMIRIADPFYIVYAVERLGAPPAFAGLYIAGMTLAGLLSIFVWPHLDRSWGREAALRLTVSATMVAPLLALGIGGLVAAFPGMRGMAAYLFTLVFILIGFSNNGRGIIFSAYMLDITPTDDRPTYLGFMNSVLGVAALLPMVGGWLVDQWGYEWVFGLAVGLLAAGALLSLRLGRPFRGTVE